jgi:hypothetical protein
MDLRQIGFGGCGFDSSGSGYGPFGADCCEHGDEPSGYIKCGELLDWLLKKDCASWT